MWHQAYKLAVPGLQSFSDQCIIVFLSSVLHHYRSSVKLQLTGHYFSRNNVSGNSTVLPLGTFSAECPQIQLC